MCLLLFKRSVNRFWKSIINEGLICCPDMCRWVSSRWINWKQNQDSSIGVKVLQLDKFWPLLWKHFDEVKPQISLIEEEMSALTYLIGSLNTLFLACRSVSGDCTGGQWTVKGRRKRRKSCTMGGEALLKTEKQLNNSPPSEPSPLARRFPSALIYTAAAGAEVLHSVNWSAAGSRLCQCKVQLFFLRHHLKCT